MLKIVIADDDEIIRMGLRAVVEKNCSDFKIVGEATNGLTALEQIRQTGADILLTDIKMPKMDGISLIRCIREEKIRLKIVVLSGYNEYEFLRDALRCGVEDYLLKPIRRRNLCDVLNKIKAETYEEYKQEEHWKRLEEKVTESLAVLREKLLLQLIEGRYHDEDECQIKLKELGIVAGQCFACAVLSIDILSSISTPAKADLLSSPIQSLKNVIEMSTVSTKHSMKIMNTLHQNNVILLFIGEEACEKNFENEIIDFIQYIRMEVKSDSYAVTAGVSCVNDQPIRTHTAYFQAWLANQNRFYVGNDQIIRYFPQDCLYDNVNENQYAGKVDKLLTCFEMCEYPKIRELVLEICGMLEKNKIEPEHFKEFITRIFEKLMITSREYMDVVGFLASGKKELLSCLRDSGTLLELKENALKIAQRLIEKVLWVRSERSKPVIKKAIEYIKIHYRENIKLKNVAEHVYLNPSYFCVLFRNETGRSFIEFLTVTRINEAKRLLNGTTVKIYEVGQDVGYEDPTTFVRAFKKVVGVSASEYRKIVK